MHACSVIRTVDVAHKQTLMSLDELTTGKHVNLSARKAATCAPPSIKVGASAGYANVSRSRVAHWSQSSRSIPLPAMALPSLVTLLP